MSETITITYRYQDEGRNETVPLCTIDLTDPIRVTQGPQIRKTTFEGRDTRRLLRAACVSAYETAREES